MLKAIIIGLFVASSTAAWCQTNRIKQLDELFESYDTLKSPGICVGILQDGKFIYQKSLGYASVESLKPINTTTVFNVASVAKQFTAACIWILVEQKKISLDDDIRKYLPEMPNYGKPIKIRHLLNHTSGIRNYHAIMDLQGFDYDKEYYNNLAILSLASTQKGLNNQPGEKVLYSNTNYNLLALIIERVSKNNLQTFAKRYLFDPIGMTSTQFKTSVNQQLPPDQATGYQLADHKYFTNNAVQESYGAGSLYSSVNDLGLWTTVLTGTNDSFKSLTGFLTTCERLSNGDTANYARGLMIDPYKGEKTITHSGSDWGSRAQLLVVPGKKVAVVVLTNLLSIDPVAISYQILDRYIDTNTALTENPSPNRLNINEHTPLRAFEGTYKEVNSDMRMDIFIENDTLHSKGGMAKKSIALVRSDDHKFRRKNNGSIEYVFTKSQSHDMVISFAGTPFYFKRAEFVDPATVKIADFTGNYYSDELKVQYVFSVQDSSLILSYPNHLNMPIFPVQQNEFGNNQRTLYHFVRDRDKKVVGMTLSSEGTVKNIYFKKR
jgi:CubicO group peptidase (beta-lactamase class C family)